MIFVVMYLVLLAWTVIKIMFIILWELTIWPFRLIWHLLKG